MSIDKLNVSLPPNYTEQTNRITSGAERDRVTTNHGMDNGEQSNKKDIQEVVSSLNDFIKPIHTNLKYELHEELDRYYVTIVNSETKEVIKEIPEKKFLDMYAKMADFMGLLLDEKI